MQTYDFGLLTPDNVAVGIYAFAEEINVCINTGPFEFVGDLSIGKASAQHLIGNRSISAESIRANLFDDIKNNTEGAKKYAFDVTVQFAKGTSRDIMNVEVVIHTTDKPVTIKFIKK